MPIRYDINPEFNMVYVYCKGYITATQYFEAADRANADERHKANMARIVDFRLAETDFNKDDLNTIIERLTPKDSKSKPDRIIILTRDKGMHLVVKTVNLMSIRADLNVFSFDTLEEAIDFLNLSDRQHEVDSFCEGVRVSTN